MHIPWNIVFMHGPKILLVLFGLWGHWSKRKRQNEAKIRAIRPPQSSPGPAPMTQSSMPSQQSAGPLGKPEASPWGNSDPFETKAKKR